jgi:hypothetical protein
VLDVMMIIGENFAFVVTMTAAGDDYDAVVERGSESLLS